MKELLVDVIGLATVVGLATTTKATKEKQQKRRLLPWLSTLKQQRWQQEKELVAAVFRLTTTAKGRLQ